MMHDMPCTQHNVPMSITKFVRIIESDTKAGRKERTVRTHDASNIGRYSTQERMQVNLMQCLVIDVGARRIAIELLLIADVVLGARLNALALDTYDSLICGFSSQIRVGT